MKFIKRLFILTLICIFLGVTALLGTYFYFKPQLPDAASLQDVQLQTPMQIFSQDGKLIEKFGGERRIPLKLDEMPPELIKAVIATEDSRFYQHFGVDPIGVTRAFVVWATTGSASQGASTITQQLARNFFLSNDRTLTRKIKEMFIAFDIEKEFTKDQILELYLNKIFLGQQSYGVGAAAHTYFGKSAEKLTLSESAIIAGLPKAPSTMNPIYSTQRATERRNVVLSRMLTMKFITQEEYNEAKAEPVESIYHGTKTELNAPYVSEMARLWAIKHFGEDINTSGMQIYTTVRSDLQEDANKAAIANLIEYDERHGYRGPLGTVWKAGEKQLSAEDMDRYLDDHTTIGLLRPAIVTKVEGKSATVYLKQRGLRTLEWDGLKWARKYISDYRQGYAPSKASDILTAGQLIFVRPAGMIDELPESEQAEEKLTKEEIEAQDEKQDVKWQVSQIPQTNTAFVAIDPNNGRILALVGGFSFTQSKFNRATMSVRQVGSSIKPFIYSAAIDKGMTLATLINDGPINTWDASAGKAWRPENSPVGFSGLTRSRIGLAQSKNVMAIRVLRLAGLDNVIDYLPRFGFDRNKLPHYETIALGAGSLTPLKMAQGISVFANGGHHVDSYYIDKVTDSFGNLLYQANPTVVCNSDCSEEPVIIDSDGTTQAPKLAESVISPQTAFLVRQMMQSNVWGGKGWNGTGWRAKSLGRHDIGGKTGTTNDSVDAWYNGFAGDIVATTWVGFDGSSRPLGRTAPNKNVSAKQMRTGGEAGGVTALPAWISFMGEALKGVPEKAEVVPNNIVKVRIDRETGLLTNKTDGSTTWEYFLSGTQPTKYVEIKNSVNDVYSSDGEESLF